MKTRLALNACVLLLNYERKERSAPFGGVCALLEHQQLKDKINCVLLPPGYLRSSPRRAVGH